MSSYNYTKLHTKVHLYRVYIYRLLLLLLVLFCIALCFISIVVNKPMLHM